MVTEAKPCATATKEVTGNLGALRAGVPQLGFADIPLKIDYAMYIGKDERIFIRLDFTDITSNGFGGNRNKPLGNYVMELTPHCEDEYWISFHAGGRNVELKSVYYNCKLVAAYFSHDLALVWLRNSNFYKIDINKPEELIWKCANQLLLSKGEWLEDKIAEDAKTSDTIHTLTVICNAAEDSQGKNAAWGKIPQDIHKR